MDWTTLIVPLIVALVGGGSVGAVVSAVITGRISARKASLEEVQVVIDNLRKGYDRLSSENAQLTSDLRRLEEVNHKLECELDLIKREADEMRRRYNRVINWARRQGYHPPEDADSE